MFSKKDGKLDLTIQLEVESGKWRPVVRWDRGPHKFFHRHLIYSDGREEKQEMPRQKPYEVIVDSIDDLKINLRNYIEETGYLEISNSLQADFNIDSFVEKAKQYLLDLVYHLEKIESFPSRGSIALKIDAILLKNEVATVMKSR